MKRILLVCICSVTLLFMSGRTLDAKRPVKDSQGHVLVKLWDSYRKADEDDLPQKKSEILLKIKETAKAKRLTWDFYDAAVKYLSNESDRNWKKRDSLSKALGAEIDAYGEPILSFQFNMSGDDEDLFEAVQKNKDKLIAGFNPEIYTGNRFDGNDALLLRNDYEYALWTIFLRSLYDRESFADRVYEVLREYVDGDYPQEFMAEYHYSLRRSEDECRSAMDSLASAYGGRAVALMPAAWLLERRYRDMPPGSSSQDYLELRDLAGSYEKERLSYRRGVDRIVAEKVTGFKSLIDRLEDRQAAVAVKDGKATVALRNISRAGIRITDGEKVLYEKDIVNDSGNFHRPDTLSFGLPVLDDGNYRIQCIDENGKTLCEQRYPKFTLSVAARSEYGRIAVFAADYLTGEPVEKAEITLACGKDTLRHEMSFDGFTYLPESSADFLKGDGRKSISCSVVSGDGTSRKSPTVYLYLPAKTKDSSSARAIVMTDRGAYNPGDTVRYKAVVYAAGSSADKAETAPEGVKVTVRLLDRKKDVIAERQQKVNEFGSVAGEFVFDGEIGSGWPYIEVRRGKRMLGMRTVRLDEFVLPSFDLLFDKTREFVAPGEKVTVKGTVRSYSGHPVTSFKAKALVRNTMRDRVLKEEEVKFAGDGSFSIEFMSDDAVVSGSAFYLVEVAVTDATGETQVFSVHRNVTSRLGVSASVLNAAEGICTLSDRDAVHIISDTVARVMCRTYYGGADVDGLELEYGLSKDGTVLKSGKVLAGSVLELDFADLSSGMYDLSLNTPQDSPFEGKKNCRLLKVRSEDTELCSSVANLIYVADGKDIAVRLGTGDAKAWYVVEIMDVNGSRVHSEVVCVEGGMKELRYEFKPEYGSCVTVGVLRFFDGREDSFSHKWHRTLEDEPDMTMTFGRFTDKTLPKHRYTYSIKGNPSSEMLVAVYDVSSDRIRRNIWMKPQKVYNEFLGLSYRSKAGKNGSGGGLYLGPIYIRGYGDEIVTVGFGTSKAGAVNDEAAVESEEAIPFQLVQKKSYDTGQVATREDFASTLAFEPFLRPDAEGDVSFGLNTSDKLSTYVVAVFSHDKSMNSSIVRREFQVTLPVGVSISEPQYLYEGDKYVLKADVFNSSAAPVDGKLYLEVYDADNYVGRTPVAVHERSISVSPESDMSVGFDIEVPSVPAMGFRLVFVGDGYEDAVFVDVPVLPARQVLTEAHSALLLPDAGETDLLEDLRSRFVNTSSFGAEYSERPLGDMFKDMMPEPYVGEEKNAVSLSEAMVINLIASSLKGEELRAGYVKAFMSAVEHLLGFVGNDGGLSWFEGGRVSPYITAIVLDRYAGLRDRGLLGQVSEICGEDALDRWDDAVADAVGYLDVVHFNAGRKDSGYGRLSLGQYLYVRSKYAGVPFDKEGIRDAIGKREFRRLCAEIRDFVGPGKKHAAKGDILGKVERIRIMLNFPEKDRKIGRLIAEEMESLREYAVRHHSGGIYYPNAVLPWAGLIADEAYAHSMICDLFKDTGMDDMADGIRLWLMLQKETQKWQSRSGFAEAAASVSDASDALKNACVAVLSKTYQKPFSEIRPYGNGIKISVRYFKDNVSDSSGKPVRVELNEGDSLKVGDRVYAEYSVWSRENRSYVRVSAPLHACLRPARQLSDFMHRPYGYREVKYGRILYWIELLPEEEITLCEETYVVQGGTFTAPPAEVECLYAPHYRAVGGTQMSLISE